ncbi:MAG: NERD domain-containing protein [Chloroflexi bacterium]|nr:NERD domain-containing protein [Chloroflexota bacterium]
MHIIHYSPFRDSDGAITKDSKAARQALGPDWRQVLQHEDTLIKSLAENLGDEYVLICNLTLPQIPHETDMILFSRRGIWVFGFFYLEGLYKTDGARLFAYSTQQQRYKRCRPDVIAETHQAAAALSQALEPSLNKQNIRLPWLIPVIILFNPKTNLQLADMVTTTILRPADFYEFSARTVRKFNDIVSEEELETIITLVKTTTRLVEPAPPQKKTFTRPETQHFGLTTSQWILLISMMLTFCLILGAIGVRIYQTPTLQTMLLTLWNQTLDLLR